MQELKGKVAFITGASRGIGAATAKLMGELGLRVILASRSQESGQIANQIRKAGGDALAVRCDVSDYAQVETAVKTAMSAFGPVDILVNNAGLIEPIGRITDLEPDEWGKVVDVNVKGVFNTLHAIIPQMEKKGAGVIINLSSGAATSALEGWSHYCASKAAALMLTKSVYTEYASKGIRVVSLSPGTVATDMQIAIKASGINPVSELDPSAHIPPEWAAKAICWLATDEAKKHDGKDVSLRNKKIMKKLGLS